MTYELLMSQYPHLLIKETFKMPKSLSGLYYDNQILINKHLCNYEKHCVLAEELGHHETTYGDITNLNEIRSRKLELVARSWGYEKIVTFDKLIECYKFGYTTTEDICIHLEIIPSFLHEALERYYQRFGEYIVHKDYFIFFDPLNVKEVSFFK